MENLRHKERDTSAMISEEGSLAARTRLLPPLLREDAITRWRLLDQPRDALHSHRFLPIYTPPDRLE